MAVKLVSGAGPGFTQNADGFAVAWGTTNVKTFTIAENLSLLDGFDFDLKAKTQKAQLTVDTCNAERELTLNENFTIGDGYPGTLTFSAASKTLTVPLDASVSGTNTGDQSVFTTIAVSGQDSVVADAASDTLTLAAGTGVTITTTAGSDTITIAASGGLAYEELTTTPVTAAVNKSYVVNNAGAICVITLPATAAAGSSIEVSSKSTDLFSVTAATGQTIRIGSTVTKAVGTITAVHLGCSITLECSTADTTWVAKAVVGNFNVEIS
jgi:hypothetical protein